MAVGDVSIQKLKIGDIDLTDFKTASYVGLNIYEDIMNPYGPVAEIRVLDHSDALGKHNLTGSYDKDVEITLSTGAGGTRTYKMKMFQNKNLSDQSEKYSGSGHHKQYDIRAVSPETLNAQGNYIQKSFNDQTHKMVEHVVKEGFKSKAKINIKSKTKGKRKIIFHNEHPLHALKKLNQEHVSAQDESSTFVLFQKQNNGQAEYNFATFEELFKGQSKVTLTQSSTIATSASSEQQKKNAILWFKPSDSFFTGSRPMSKGSEHTINLTTHKVSAIDPKQTKSGNFKLIDSPIYKQQSNSSQTKQIPVHSVLDMAGNDEKHETSSARVKRAAFLSYLAQQAAELEVPYNPDINVGDVITLNIPKKANSDSEQGEKQFNGKVLVVAIRIKIKPPGQSPNCTMILRVTKGGSVKQGGNDEA